MPRKPAPAAPGDPAAPMDKTQRKSERSHEENQERAYIAASRRADRSIEARVQSARMASEIHKKRTGKGFRITEEIVIKEEMYEEDDDDLPRSYRLLGSHMQTDPAELTARVETYLSNRVNMSAMLARTNDEWRESEIHRLFDQSFPNAGQQAQQLSQNMAAAAMYNHHHQPSPMPADRPVFHSVSYIPRSKHHDHARSRSMASPASAASPYASPYGTPTPGSNPDMGPAFDAARASFDAVATTPGFDAARAASAFDAAAAMGSDTPLQFGPSPGSAFTAELPPEAKMLIGGVAMDAAGYGQAMYAQNWPASTHYHDPSEVPRAVRMAEQHEAAMVPDYYAHDPTAPAPMTPMTPIKWDATNNVVEDSWDTFINDAAWGNEQQ